MYYLILKNVIHKEINEHIKISPDSGGCASVYLNHMHIFVTLKNNPMA